MHPCRRFRWLLEYGSSLCSCCIYVNRKLHAFLPIFVFRAVLSNGLWSNSQIEQNLPGNLRRLYNVSCIHSVPFISIYWLPRCFVCRHRSESGGKQKTSINFQSNFLALLISYASPKMISRVIMIKWIVSGSRGCCISKLLPWSFAFA